MLKLFDKAGVKEKIKRSVGTNQAAAEYCHSNYGYANTSPELLGPDAGRGFLKSTIGKHWGTGEEQRGVVFDKIKKRFNRRTLQKFSLSREYF